MITFGEAAEFYRQAADLIEEDLHAVVVTVAARAAERARATSATCNPLGPLSDATVEGFWHPAGFWITGKRELGFEGPDYEPLRRSGQMEQSIEPVADGLAGGVVSDDKVMLFQEMGTPGARFPIPPRPVLALGLMHSIPDLVEECGQVAVRALVPTRK